MKPGRELDILIAQKVMKWKTKTGIPLFVSTVDQYREERSEKVCITAQYNTIPRYSTDIEAAFTLVEKINRWRFTLRYETDFGGGGKPPYNYVTAIFDPVSTNEIPDLFVKSETAAHAICLSALKAVGYEFED